jgi:hypothetical protein
MTCESPIDQGDSRSYSLTVLLGSHRVKGTRRSRAPVEGLLGFFMFEPRETNLRGDCKLARMAVLRKGNAGAFPTFCRE